MSGSVWDARGFVADLHVEVGGVVTGHRSEPLAVADVSRARGGYLAMISFFQLLEPEVLGELEQAEQLSPWIPRSARQIKKALEGMFWPLPPEQESGHEDVEPEPSLNTAWSQRAHFWARMSRLVRNKHASGSVQADTRLTAAICRRRSLGWERQAWRERLLLSLHALVGYGERIGLPLYWHVGLSLPVFLYLTWERLPTLTPDSLIQAWLRVLFAPLAFFRLVDVPIAQWIMPRLVLLLYQILGILFLFFFITAVRRVAKAE